MDFSIYQSKRSNCHKTNCKHIDWTPGLKCDQWVWPGPWPWHLNFQGQTWSWPFVWPRSVVRIYHLLFVTMCRCESMCGNNNKTGRISSTHSDILYIDLEKIYVKVVNINSTFRERQNIWLVGIRETQRNICEAPAYCTVASKDMKLASLVYIVTERCYD